jgi:hypothetical protein
MLAKATDQTVRHVWDQARRDGFEPLPGDDALPEPSPELQAWVEARERARLDGLKTYIGHGVHEAVIVAYVELVLWDGPTRRWLEAAMRRPEVEPEPLPPAVVEAIERTREHFGHRLSEQELDLMVATKVRNVQRTISDLRRRENVPGEEELERLAEKMRRSEGFRMFLEFEAHREVDKLGALCPDEFRRAMVANKLDIDLAHPVLIWINERAYRKWRIGSNDDWQIPPGMPDPNAPGSPPPTLRSMAEAWRARARMRLMAVIPSETYREGFVDGLWQIVARRLPEWEEKGVAVELPVDSLPGYVKMIRERAAAELPLGSPEHATLPPSFEKQITGALREILVDAFMTQPGMRQEIEQAYRDERREAAQAVREAWERILKSPAKGQA